MYRNPAIIDYSDFKEMCGYQPTCACNFSETRGYNLGGCPDYCHCYNPNKKPITSEAMDKYYHEQLNELVNLLSDHGQRTLAAFED